jgi:O-antigen biosynthesis protein
MSFITILKKAFYLLQNKGAKYFFKKLIIIIKHNLYTYQRWVSKYDTITPKNQKRLASLVVNFKNQPLISIILIIDKPQLEFLKICLEAITKQIYQHWQLIVVDDQANLEITNLLLTYQNTTTVKNLNLALEASQGQYFILLNDEDTLRAHALFHLVDTINKHPDVALIYSDEDQIDNLGKRFNPHFKSDFNYELFLAYNMLNRLIAYKTAVAREVGGFDLNLADSYDYDLSFKFLEKCGFTGIYHIPRILYHQRGGLRVKKSDTLVISNHLKRIGVDASITKIMAHYHRVKFALPKKLPLVSIIIPTKDKLKLLSKCIESIEQNRHLYSNYEIIIINNNSVEEKTHRYLKTLKAHAHIKVIDDTAAFNYSALNNRAAKIAQGEILCLMNNDIEIITPDWLGEMVSFALRADVGCVGARLWYPNNTLQHAGVIMGLGGLARHAHLNLKKDQAGYFGRAILHQSFSVVTAACLVVRRGIFQQASGLEEKLATDFNDVDFCLKVGQLGYRNVWTPFAEMFHHESASRGPHNTLAKRKVFNEECAYMQEKWHSIIKNDPCYNPNLSLAHESFLLDTSPRINTIV